MTALQLTASIANSTQVGPYIARTLLLTVEGLRKKALVGAVDAVLVKRDPVEASCRTLCRGTLLRPRHPRQSGEQKSIQENSEEGDILHGGKWVGGRVQGRPGTLFLYSILLKDPKRRYSDHIMARGRFAQDGVGADSPNVVLTVHVSCQS